MFFAALILTTLPVLAASPDAPAIDGRHLSLLWILPFVGILLSIAIMPLAAPHFWHHHFGKVSAAWALMVVIPFGVLHGVPTAVYEIFHLLLLDYIPFIVLLLALFTVTGGIHIRGNLHGSPSMNTALELQNVLRDFALVAICVLSLKLTSRKIRSDNVFSWGPMLEVAKLFAGIFITIAPAIAILKAGSDGALAPLVALVTNSDGQPNDIWYFWLTGILSSFLDNAPTYLVFFNLAGGDPHVLMGALASTLAAISCGAVFMGANTYIGNAPNFMVKAVVEEAGIRMPSFFGYMAWSGVILVPLFVALTFLFF